MPERGGGALTGTRLTLVTDGSGKHRPGEIPDVANVTTSPDTATVAQGGATSHIAIVGASGYIGRSVVERPATVPPLEQWAAFRPKGLLGLASWRMLCPLHWVVVRAMTRGQVRRAGAESSRTHTFRRGRSRGQRHHPGN